MSAQPFPHRLQSVAALVESSQTDPLHSKVFPGASAPFGGGIPTPGLHVPLSLQPRERSIKCSDRHPASRSLFDLATDRHTVSLVAQPQNGQKNDLLKFTQVIA